MRDINRNALIEGLRALYRGDDEDYKTFFDKAAVRKKNLWNTAITSIASMLAGSREDAIVVGKEMDRIGAGQFIVGRRGAETRVEWNFRLDSIGQVARGDHDELIAISAEEEEEVEEKGHNEVPGKPRILDDFPVPDGWLLHTFRLRPTELALIALPEDLTQTEADRMADFIRSLPFDRPY